MQIKEFVEKASRTDAPLSSSREHDTHMILGMLTEVGELADIYKKNLAYNREIDFVNVKEELGDLMWYVANFCRTNGYDLEEILAACIKKLEVRYPEKFTEENANNRNLENERATLEKAGRAGAGKHTVARMNFYQYCIEIEHIPYYNSLTPDEFDAVYERYEKYMEEQA